MNTNLTGVTAVTATTAADANGFVVCGGQEIVDATSPLNGQTIPNLNDSYFLMGASSSGSTGGANTTTLTTTQLPAHTHTVVSTTHTHTMPHVHQTTWIREWVALQYAVDNRSIRDPSTLSFDSFTGSAKALAYDWILNGATSGSTRLAQVSAGTGAGYSAGAIDESGNAAISGVPTGTEPSGSAGSGSSYDSRPKFFAVRFIMRIK